MSISELSNHLCLVVVIIISHLFASTLFRQVCEASDSHDFSNSRQFKRNLLVSKYQNNTHWLPHYTWKPPEKFSGSRKRPAWELKKAADSEMDKIKKKEYEEWEEKMRNMGRKAREKWKTHENENSAESNRSSMSSGGTSSRITENTESDVETRNGTLDASITEQDGRKFSSEASKTKNDDESTSPIVDDTTRPSIFPSKRWGMSVKDPPKKFLQEISEQSKVFQGSKHSLMKYDDEVETNQRKNKMPPKASKSSKTTNENPQSAERSSQPSDSEDQKATTTTFPPGRWGISVKEPPKDFLKEIARRSETFEIPDEVWKQNESKNRKFYDVGEARGKLANNIGRASRKLSMGLSTGRWGMDETFPPGKFLREISRHGHPGIGGFYKPGFSHQLVADTIPINDPRSRELTSSRRLRISNVLFLQPSLGILEAPMFPGFLMNSRILKISSNHNVPRIRCRICLV